MAPISSAVVATILAIPAAAGPCLCVFDMDRTLTGKQGALDQCPGDVGTSIPDRAYEGGTLTLSDAEQHLANTFCGKCYMGTVSAGDGGGDGSAEQTELRNHLSIGMGELPRQYHYGCSSVASPLVVTCTDGQKQIAVAGIQAWHAANLGVAIADEDIYMFDDRVSNIEPFKYTNYNARQISCATRDPLHNNEIGLCGAAVGEIVADKGVYLCGDAPAPAPSPTPPPAPTPTPTWSCSVGDVVNCQDSVNTMCAGNQCCQDGSTCPSADATYSLCPRSKNYDCIVASAMV